MIADVLSAPAAWRTRSAAGLRRLQGGLGDLLEAERARWTLWGPVLLGLGVAIYFSLRREPPPSAGIVLFVGLAALCAGLRRRPPLARIAAVLTTVAAGFLAAQLRTAIVAAPILHAPVAATTVSGVVDDIALSEKSARVTLADVAIGRIAPTDTPQRVRISLTRYSAIPRLGERIVLKAKLFRPPAPAAPQAHDFRRDLFYQRIGGVGYAVRRFVEPSSAAPPEPAPILGRLRQAAAERVSAAFPDADQKAERAIALALLAGERGPIPDSVNDSMRDAGLAHLLAISGMNITIAAGLLYFTLRLALAAIPFVALRFPIKKFAAAGGLIGGILYTEFVGAPVSAERSMITTGFVMIAIMLDRSAITLRLVAISASLLILAEPEALMGPSFQMSYGAIVALVVVYERWNFHALGGPDPGPLRQAGRYLLGIAGMSVIASAASAVFAIYHFQQSAFYGLGANLLAVPIHDLWIMPWGIASYFLMPFGLETLSLRPMGWGIQGMLWTARLFAGFPGASGHFEAMPPAALASIVSGGLWFLLWTRRWRLLGLGPVAVGIALTLAARQPDLLIAEDGKLVAIRQESGELALSTTRHDRFTQSVWLRRAGEGEIEDHPPARLPDQPPDQGCDAGLCRFAVAGRKGAVIADARGLRAGCAGMDIAISPLPLRGRCAAPLIVDADDLARDGAVSILFDGDRAQVATVRDTAGDRPWTGR